MRCFVSSVAGHPYWANLKKGIFPIILYQRCRKATCNGESLQKLEDPTILLARLHINSIHLGLWTKFPSDARDGPTASPSTLPTCFQSNQLRTSPMWWIWKIINHCLCSFWLCSIIVMQLLYPYSAKEEFLPVHEYGCFVQPRVSEHWNNMRRNFHLISRL